MKTELVAVAHLVRPRGIKGELIAIPLNDRRERFDELRRVIVKDAEQEIERAWWHQDKLILKFRGIDTMTAAEALMGADVFIPAGERANLPDGEYYLSDIVGCEVVDRATGRALGRISGWQETGATPLLEIEGSDVLIPFARSICTVIDLEARRIVIDPPTGLLDLNL